MLAAIALLAAGEVDLSFLKLGTFCRAMSGLEEFCLIRFPLGLAPHGGSSLSGAGVVGVVPDER